MLVGGTPSVLPLPILPYAPEQSGEHYPSHTAFAAAQVPLVPLCLSRPRSGAAPRGRGAVP